MNLTQTSHGMSKTRLHNIWINMRHRCSNQDTPAYKNYGGRGIKVCDEWDDFFVFYKWSLRNNYNESLSIDRLDNDGDYSPSNCQWANMISQSRNKRSSVKFKGECAIDASYRLGGKRSLVTARLRGGWSKEEAFTKPVLKITKTI